MNRIALADCKHGGLYRIRSRNLDLGVFDQTRQGFVGIREKFGHKYLDLEFHWECGPPFGTVTPLEFLEDCPIADLATSHLVEVDGEQCYRTNAPLFAWLTAKAAQYCQ